MLTAKQSFNSHQTGQIFTAPQLRMLNPHVDCQIVSFLRQSAGNLLILFHRRNNYFFAQRLCSSAGLTASDDLAENSLNSEWICQHAADKRKASMINILGFLAAVLTIGFLGLVQAQVPTARIQCSSTYGMAVPMARVGSYGGTNNYFISNYTPPYYGTNLWLEITNIADGAVDLLLHNTQPLVPYQILSCETLTSDSAWLSEGMVMGVENNILTPTTVNIGDRTTCLFLRALSWIDSDADGIPDWWMLKYFCHPTGEPTDHSLASDDYDVDGVNNLQEFSQGTDPNKIWFTVQFPSYYVNTNSPSGTLTIFRGVPSYITALVNDANHADGTWQLYNSNIVVNLNAGDGNYDVWVGLRGLPSDTQQIWQKTHLVLDTVSPTLIVTNPIASVVSQSTVQLQGYANESLGSLSFDVSNSTGSVTNRPGYVTGVFFDVNLSAYTTNWFQCPDIELGVGLNIITLHASDLAGNTTNVDVILDYVPGNNPPRLTVIWPQSDTQVSGSSFTLEAQVDNPTVTVTASIVDADGNNTTVTGLVEQNGLVWVQNLPVAVGPTILKVIATDPLSYYAHADRYTYLPQIGLYLLLTWAVADLCAGWRYRRVVLGGGATIILGVLIFCARAQTAYWRNSEALWTHTLACTSDNFIGENGLGNALAQKGSMDKAIAHYQMALRIVPGNEEVCYNLGNALLKKGDMDEAIAQYHKALLIKSDYGEAHNNLGKALFKKGDVEEAIAQYQRALQIKPDDMEIRNNLAVALSKAHGDYANTLVRMGRDGEAMVEFRKALELFPDFADARHDLAVLLLEKGQVDEAIAQFLEIWKKHPGDAMASFDLGNAYFQNGQLDEAVASYQRALKIKPDDVSTLNNFGMVLLTKGMTDEAAVQFRAALTLQPDFALARTNLSKALRQKEHP